MRKFHDMDTVKVALWLIDLPGRPTQQRDGLNIAQPFNVSGQGTVMSRNGLSIYRRRNLARRQLRHEGRKIFRAFVAARRWQYPRSDGGFRRVVPDAGQLEGEGAVEAAVLDGRINSHPR